MNSIKIKRAIISVSDKSNLRFILPILKKFNIEIISSGGSYKKIKKLKYKCTEISNYTQFSEMLNGRVKTLHPKIYAGILNIRKNIKHKKDLEKFKIPNIDLVIVDLYPFEKKLSENKKLEELIEYIDIGGPSLIRAAAKNFHDVAVVSNTNDYTFLVNELKINKGYTTLKFRKFMSAKAFSLTAYYDSVISNYLNNNLKIKFPEKMTIHGNLFEKLRYGENPHQDAGLYTMFDNNNLQILNGKALSYNNYNDVYSALNIMNSFKKNEGAAIIKHANPSGVSCEKNPIKSYQNALMCDPISAFGGVVIINSSISRKLALELNKMFFEIIVARGFNKIALKILKKKKNLRLIDCSKFKKNKNKSYLFLDNSFLIQDTDNIIFSKKLKFVSKKKPSMSQLNSLKFAFNVCKFVKSNAIVLANDKSTIGIGAGQPSRIDSCKIASDKAKNFVPKKLTNCVAASDAFFPFPDGVNKLIKSGVKAIIQPGGSKNDKEVIKTADAANIPMIFTRTRHFKH